MSSMLFLRSSRPCVHFKKISSRVLRQFSAQNYKPLQKVDTELADAEEEEEEEVAGEAKLVELEHPYKDMRFFLLGVPFTDVQRVEEVCEDLQPDYILISYDSERLDKITHLKRRTPAWLKTTTKILNPNSLNFRDNFDIMLYALMCGHHHLDPALEYCKKNNKPLYAVDRPEFLTTFRASGETVGRLPSMLSTGKTVKMLSPFVFGQHKVEDLTQEFLEDARESLDSEDIDFERQQLMKLPAFGEERGEIMAHRMFYFEGEPGSKVLGICQRSLFDHVIPEWGKTTDEDMHWLHMGPNDKRKSKAKYVAAAGVTCLYTLPFYIASAYLDPTMVGIMWAAIPTYFGVVTPFKVRAAAQRTEDFYNKVLELDRGNGLSDRWRTTDSNETTLGPENIEKPEPYMEMVPRQRFSPMNFGDPLMQPLPGDHNALGQPRKEAATEESTETSSTEQTESQSEAKENVKQS